jgi:hypothetical protein
VNSLSHFTTIGLLLGTLACRSSALESPADIIESEIKAARAEAESESRTTKRDVNVADKVFLPDREERIARQLAHLAIASRGSGEEAKKAILYSQRQREGAPQEELEKLGDAVRKAAIHDGAIAQARMQFGKVFGLLHNLKDRRTVRLIAPLLNEEEEGTSYTGPCHWKQFKTAPPALCAYFTWRGSSTSAVTPKAS